MSLFRVIVEMFPVEYSLTHMHSFLNETKPDQKNLIKILSNTKGIYAFYNSEFELIYLGKTKNNLWYEMKNAYTREMPHYKRYQVHHPRSKYAPTKSGVARKLVLRNLIVWQAATYFSAYDIDESMIDEVEQLLIRIMPNDILNKRMEGNYFIQIYSPTADDA